MIRTFEGRARDLDRLDALCVECWLAVTRVGNPIGMTRVRSAGRLHVWPGDPDDIAALLFERGFLCASESRPDAQGTTTETTVTVLGVQR